MNVLFWEEGDFGLRRRGLIINCCNNCTIFSYWGRRQKMAIFEFSSFFNSLGILATKHTSECFVITAEDTTWWSRGNNENFFFFWKSIRDLSYGWRGKGLLDGVKPAIAWPNVLSRKSTHIKQKKGKFPRTLSVSRHSSIPAPIEKKSKRFNFQPSKLRKTTKIYKNPNPSLSLSRTLSVIVNPILFSLCIYLLI